MNVEATRRVERQTKPPQIVCEDVAAREVEHVARREREFETADVTARRAILERARAGTVGRHGCAEIATALGRVGRVEQPARFDRALKIREHDARFYGCPPAIHTFHDLANAI